MIGRKIAILSVLLCCLAANSTDIPPRPSGFVSDTSSILEADGFKELDAKLRNYHDTKGGNLVVVVMKTLKGEDIETASLNIAREWKVGRKGESKGLLFVVAIQDRKMRMEVGEGLEGKITDGKAGELIDTAKPFFKAGKYTEGINRVVDLTIIAAGTVTAVTSPAASPSLLFWFVVLLFILLLIFLLWQGLGWLNLDGSWFTERNNKGGGGSFSGGGASSDW